MELLFHGSIFLGDFLSRVSKLEYDKKNNDNGNHTRYNMIRFVHLNKWVFKIHEDTLCSSPYLFSI
jgi:hypothetical protein